ncbi:MAG: DUF975 family protein [Candidatus Nomurabacteria bacterium]|jgi:uncharacterized membrane protein|nr:DUF975 family protein [Candidatus Nomurabacteria bacterium]
MNRVELKNQAKKVLTGKVFILFLIMFVPSLIISLASYTGWGAVVTILVSGSLEYALSLIFLNVLRKNTEPKFEELLAGFKDNNFGRTLEAFVRMMVFTFLWSLLFVIPGIIKAISYSQMFYLMADDKKLSAADAQKQSMAMMEGHKMDYFVLSLSFILWAILCGITFGLAFIYVGPYMQLTYTAFYDKLKGTGSHAKAKEAKLA